MRIGEVTTDVVGADVRCTVDVEVDHAGSGSFPLVVTLPRTFVGLLDASTAAFAPLAAAVCGAPESTSDAWHAPPKPGWVGLAYDAGADAAATLVDPPRPITHLITVDELDATTPQADGRRRELAVVAEQRGLGLVTFATNARALATERGRGAELDASLWRALSRLLPAFSEIVVPAPRVGALATVARDPVVLRHVVVCDEYSGASNCGRCAACVRALTELEVAGAIAPEGLFDQELTDDAVRATVAAGGLDDLLRVVAGIPDECAYLQQTWSSALVARLDERGDARWSPAAVVRLAHALVRSGAHLPDDVSFGWRPGEVALRAEHDARHRLVRRLHDPGARPASWAMVDASDDGAGAARCAALLEERWGRGVVWGHGPGGAGDEALRARTLRLARVRVWWRDAGDLDAARVLDTIEHGCLPLQAMPPRAADLARQRLPDRLRDLVIGISDTGPEAVTDDDLERRMRDAIAELVAGSLERDLAAAGADA